MMKPSVGRIVHFYDHTIAVTANHGVGPGPYPALIIKVNQTEFIPTEEQFCLLHVFYTETERTTGTSPMEGDVVQRPNDVYFASGRYWIEPPRV